MIPAPDHPDGPGQLEHGARHDGAQAADAEEPAPAVRSVDCWCTARAGTPCGPTGDHLARYLRAEQSGVLTRQALTGVIAGLDVIAPQVIIQPPDGQAAQAGPSAAQGRGLTRPDAGISADRASAEPEAEAG